jgi:alkaline phosphatase
MLFVSVITNSLYIVWADSEGLIKNVIFMIPDGGGFALFDLANGVKEMGGFKEGLFPNATNIAKGPMHLKNYLIGTETTHSLGSMYTDSAAAGTALSSGYKTNNGRIGVDAQGRPRATILEAAQLAGKRTGTVTTYHWSHATPAAFTAHNISRENYEILSEQVVNQGLDVVLGVGFGSAKWGSIDEVINRGYTIVNNKKELAAIPQGTRLWGNMANSGFPMDISLTDTQPTLAEMTDAAINALEGDDDGFFLMIEGSSIDGGGHSNNILQVVSEYLAFDAAFNVAVEYAKARTDTVVIAMPDHDTGGLILPNADEVGGNPNYNDYIAAVKEIIEGKNSSNGISWESKDHTDRRGGVWMYAPDGIKPPEGLADTPGDNPTNRGLKIDNIKIAPYLADLMGLDLEAATNELFVDVTGYGTYDSNNNTFTFDDVDVKIVANQSVAAVEGDTVDLKGEIAVYSKDKFYVSQSLLSQTGLEIMAEDSTPEERISFFDTVVAAKNNGEIVVDGNITDEEWETSMTMEMNTKNEVHTLTSWNGVADHSAIAYVKWDDENLYLAVKVEDNFHSQPHKNVDIWKGDSFQFAFYDGNIHELQGDKNTEVGVALFEEDIIKFRYSVASGKTPGFFENIECSIVRDGTQTNYELSVPWEELLESNTKIGDRDRYGLSLLVNDNDGNERKSWLQYGSGIGGDKDITVYKNLVLSSSGVNILSSDIILKIGSNKATINNNEVDLDVPAQLLGGRTMVPIRFVGESLGAEVQWEPSTETVKILKGKTVITLKIGETAAKINDKKIELDVAPIIESGKTMVPIRFIGEAFGADVKWDGGNEEINISMVEYIL